MIMATLLNAMIATMIILLPSLVFFILLILMAIAWISVILLLVVTPFVVQIIRCHGLAIMIGALTLFLSLHPIILTMMFSL